MLDEFLCPSKTGHFTQETGEKSVSQFVNVLETVVKEVQPIQTAERSTEEDIHLQAVESFLRLPTSTIIQPTVIQKIYEPGANDVISPMTPSIMQTQEEKQEVSASTTSNRRSLVWKSKNPTHKDLMNVIRHDELQLQIHQMQLEAYKPAMDALKRYLEIFGSQSPNFYMTKNKQISAACQMNGINDPTATRKQRIAAMTCYEMIYETIMRCLELGFDKEQVKQAMNEAINKAAEFFGLGNKRAVSARNKQPRKTK